MYFKRIITLSNEEIKLKVSYSSVELWKIVESIFHGAGLHLRHIFDFQKHIFLVKVLELIFLNDLKGSTATVYARLAAKSPSGALYRGSIGTDSGEKILRAEFMLGVKEFDEVFKREHITPYYERLFRCLMDTKTK